MFGFKTKEFAIDLGSSRIRIADKEHVLLVSDASTAILYQHEKVERIVLAYGNNAEEMHGKIPKPLQEISAIRDGAVWDKECLREIMRNLMVQVNERLLWVNQPICICVPAQANLVEKKIIQKIMKEAGGGKIRFVNRAMATAQSIQIPFHEPHGHLIIDIGAHITEMTLLSCSDVVKSQLIKIGGEVLSLGIVRHLRKKKGIEISLLQAETIKEKYGAALWDSEVGADEFEIKGKSVRSSFPKAVWICPQDVIEGLGEPLQALLEAIQEFLDAVPLEVATDIAQTGIVLVGGGAKLRDLDEAIALHTNLPVIIPENPESLCVIGALDLH